MTWDYLRPRRPPFFPLPVTLPTPEMTAPITRERIMPAINTPKTMTATSVNAEKNGVVHADVEASKVVGSGAVNNEIYVSGATVFGYYPTYVSSGMRIVMAYKLNDSAGSANGAVGTTDTSCTIPVVSRIDIGSVRSVGNYLNGYIRKLSYYPLRLTNAQLQALTGS